MPQVDQNVKIGFELRVYDTEEFATVTTNKINVTLSPRSWPHFPLNFPLFMHVSQTRQSRTSAESAHSSQRKRLDRILANH